MQMMLCFSLNAYTSLFIVFEIQRDYNDDRFCVPEILLVVCPHGSNTEGHRVPWEDSLERGGREAAAYIWWINV